MPRSEEKAHLVRQVDEELLEACRVSGSAQARPTARQSKLTVRLEDLETSDIQYADESLGNGSTERLVHPVDNRTKHALVQRLAHRCELIHHLLWGSRLSDPLATGFHLWADEGVGEVRVVEAEKEGDHLHLRAVDEMRLLRSCDRDVAEVEDSGEDFEQLELLGGGEADDGEGVLVGKHRQPGSPYRVLTWSTHLEESPLFAIINASDRVCRTLEVLVILRASFEQQLTWRARRSVRVSSKGQGKPRTFERGVGAAKELVEDVVIALARRPGSHSGLLEKVPVDVGSDDGSWRIEEDADEFTLFSRARDCKWSSFGAVAGQENSRNETSCRCA